MSVWSRLKSLLRNRFYQTRIEVDLDQELRAYIDQITEEKIAAGIRASEARRTTLAEFGGIEPVKAAVRENRAGAHIDRLCQDLRYGKRQLWRNPGFTVTVVVTLALSIGANTAIFSIVNALMLKQLPYPHPDRIGTVFTRINGLQRSEERRSINGEQWELIRDNVPALIPAISGPRDSGVNLQAGSRVEYVHSGRVSAHYFDVLGIQPRIGRFFSAEEDRPEGPRTVVLTFGLWHRVFAANTAIIGQSILLKGEPYIVVGVLPEAAMTPLNADLYTAIQATRDGEGGGTNFQLITRLREGATWQEADGEIGRAWLHRANRYELRKNAGATITYYSVPLQRGQTAELRPQVLGLMFAASLILLIACANLAALTLVRVLRRTPEVATRMALGASQWQIQRQLWVENILLALLGGTGGVALAYVSVRGLLRILPANLLPAGEVPLDSRVLGFALFLSMATSILFGMLPALLTSKLDIRSAIGSRTTTGDGHLRLRQVLIISEVALTAVLLTGAGLLIRTLVHLETLPPGFVATGVLTARVSLDDVRYHDPAAFRKLLNESTAAMQRIPGVRQAAVASSLPYERSLNMGGLNIKDGKDAGQDITTAEVYVTPEYFATLQVPILAGRAFTNSDGPSTEPVAIVNRSFVSMFFHGGDALGKHLGEDLRIVGISENVYVAPGIDPVAPLTSEPILYIPAAQLPASMLSMIHVWFQPSWIVRTSAPIEGLTAQMQRALASADPNVPFSGVYSMHALMMKTLATQRVEVVLLSTMAALALLLSAIGIFALVADIVARKNRELGIRLALGSTLRQAMFQVGAPGVGASAIGLALGLIVCAATMRFMRSVLFGVSIYDAPTILIATAILGSAALIATVLPILKVASIDPVHALREE